MTQRVNKRLKSNWGTATDSKCAVEESNLRQVYKSHPIKEYCFNHVNTSSIHRYSTTSGNL